MCHVPPEKSYSGDQNGAPGAGTLHPIAYVLGSFWSAGKNLLSYKLTLNLSDYPGSFTLINFCI